MKVVIASLPGDVVAAGAAPTWAMGRLAEALTARGVDVAVVPGVPVAGEADVVILAVGDRRVHPRSFPVHLLPPLEVPEAIALVPARSPDGPVLLVGGSDARGLTYGLLELADRVACARDPWLALDLREPVLERPANRVRSVTRLFTSEHHDKPWFHDQAFWGPYLDTLAAQRFNRFSLTFGLGYNFPWQISDAYLNFAYPFLVDVPGYGVTVSGIDASERQRNLETLRFASEETVRRGMGFQLGLWNHAYEWIASPAARHIVGGLSPETHANYCRDALLAVLEACPAIGGVTLRVHGESGVRERSWVFWRTVFEALERVGRPIEVDLHAKGLDEETLRAALATGLPVTVSPKFWAEHMGLPYHQAAIREMERRPVDLEAAGGKQEYMRVSEGTRPFTRYGYGDFLREDREYAIVFRIWPGTQRLLLWGDPAMAAGYGRSAGIAGSDGFEWMEPLTFRGREGSSDEGSRGGYADAALAPTRDWEKYEYWYRLVGRLGYDPEAEPDQWRRFLGSRFGPAADSAERALAAASGILPLVTTAFHPSASNNYYWPELYTNLRIAWSEGDPPTHLAFDTPAPGRFATVSPLDPELFCGVAEAVDEALAGQASGRYTPIDVARWLDERAARAGDLLARFERESPSPMSAEGRRLAVDVSILAALGRYFAGLMRAAVRYELHLRLGDPSLLASALEAYGRARDAWSDAAQAASGVYLPDLAFGPQAWLRGHWADRLDAIDADIEAMRSTGRVVVTPAVAGDGWIARLLERQESASVRPTVSHGAPETFRRGEPISVALALGDEMLDEVVGIRLRYRRMDQSESYQVLDMERRVGRPDRFEATIPAAYTDAPRPIQYHFVVLGHGAAWLSPGLGDDLCRRPYFVVRQLPWEAEPTIPGSTM